MIYTYNYYFRKANNTQNNTYMLIEGGGKVGTTTSGVWLYDGQIFKKIQWLPPEQPKIVKVYI